MYIVPEVLPRMGIQDMKSVSRRGPLGLSAYTRLIKHLINTHCMMMSKSAFTAYWLKKTYLKVTYSILDDQSFIMNPSDYKATITERLEYSWRVVLKRL